MILLIDLVSGLFIFSGCFFVIAGAVGMIRMPDLYTRIHAASVIDTMGTTFIIIGLLLQNITFFDNSMASIKLILILIFIHFGAPTASHAIAKMALMMGVTPSCQNGQSIIEHSLSSPIFRSPNDEIEEG